MWELLEHHVRLPIFKTFRRNEKIISWYADSISRKIHPIEIAAIFHQRFECIDHWSLVFSYNILFIFSIMFEFCKVKFIATVNHHYKVVS